MIGSVREIESIRLSPRLAFAPPSQTKLGMLIHPLCDCSSPDLRLLWRSQAPNGRFNLIVCTDLQIQLNSDQKFYDSI